MAKKASTARKSKRKASAEPRSRGLAPADVVRGEPPAAARKLARDIEDDGGVVLATYRDPLGGHWQCLAVLPLERVEPTPFQRDLSEAHAGNLAAKVGQLDRFLDPVITVRTESGAYWTPNGRHRTDAMRRLGAVSIAALVLPDPAVAYRILALNTEKAHNVRERALEVIRMARSLAELDPRPEREFEAEFEEPALITLGACYEQRGRFSGGAYHPVLKRADSFLSSPLPKALAVRDERARALCELDDAVVAIVQSLKARGFESPYLKTFVIARINPLRFQRGATADFDEVVAKMLSSAKRFDASKVKTGDLARTGGAPDEG